MSRDRPFPTDHNCHVNGLYIANPWKVLERGQSSVGHADRQCMTYYLDDHSSSLHHIKLVLNTMK